jgi:hypothetical protein
LHTQLLCAVDPATDCEFVGHARQVFAAVAPSVIEYVLTPQLVHATEPVASLNFPAPHAVHVPPSVPVCPRAQRQAETAVCPVSDVTEFAGQVEHELSAAAPVTAEYLPEAHVTQSDDSSLPAVVRYVPAAQSRQEVVPHSTEDVTIAEEQAQSLEYWV